MHIFLLIKLKSWRILQLLKMVRAVETFCPTPLNHRLKADNYFEDTPYSWPG